MTSTGKTRKQIELQLKNLLKQAEEASRYKIISNDIKKQEALLSYLKIQEINKELKESQEGLNEIDDDISAVTIEKNYSNELLESENKRIKPLRNDFAEITSKLQRLNLEYEDLFKQEQRTKEESEKLRIDLKNIFKLIASRNGRKTKIGFSTEHQSKGGFYLQASGRYSHSKAYIQSLCDEYGYKMVHFSVVNLRRENGKFLTGAVYIVEWCK